MSHSVIPNPIEHNRTGLATGGFILFFPDTRFNFENRCFDDDDAKTHGLFSFPGITSFGRRSPKAGKKKDRRKKKKSVQRSPKAEKKEKESESGKKKQKKRNHK